MANRILESLFSRFGNELDAERLALADARATQAPIGKYKNIPTAEEEAAMKAMFTPDEAGMQEQARAQLRGLFGGVGPLTQGDEVAVPALAKLQKPFESPREKFQKEEGMSPDTPTNIALSMQKANKDKITEKWLLEQAMKDNRAEIMSRGAADRANRADGRQDKGIAAGFTKSLQDDYVKASDAFPRVVDAYNRVIKSANDPTPAGDLSLIFNYMKVLDPGSTVREGEFAQAARTGSLPTQIQATAGRLIKGERLTAEQRADFVQRTAELYQGAANQQALIEAQFTQRAEKLGIDPSQIVLDYRSKEKPPESLTSFLKRKDIPDGLKAKAAMLKGRGIDESTILKALKQDAGIK